MLWFGVWSLLLYALLYVLSNFAIILTRTKELVDFLLNVFLMSCFLVNVLLLFLTVPWVGLQCVILVGHELLRVLLPPGGIL